MTQQVKRLALIMIVVTVLAPCISVSAVSVTKSQLKRKYKSWFTLHDYYPDSSNLTFVDIDRNGVIEAICQGDGGDGCLLTFSISKKKIIKMLSGEESRVFNPISYNTKKHMVCCSAANEEEQWAAFYKLKGTKLSKGKRFYRNNYVCRINGKKVSTSSYKKQLKALKKGFKGGWIP